MVLESASAFRLLYFGAQWARHGVSPEQIRAARALLDQPRPAIEQHIRQRLETTHHASPDALAWLASRPLVDRVTLQGPMAELLRSRDRSVDRRHTSGSTGTPFVFPKSKEMTAWMDAAMWAVYAWHGVRPGDRQARFWGLPLSRGARIQRRVTDLVQARRRLSAFEIDPARSVEFLARLRRWRPRYVYGYPTLIRQFVEHCEHQGLHGGELGISVVISTGELLAPEVRRSVAGFFACPVVNEYGCTESGIVAFECEAGTLHEVPVAALAEIVDPNGAGVAPGRPGEVAISDLYGSVAPLLRYRLHDRASLADLTSCRCGRALRALGIEEGRIDSFIQTPHRGAVYDAILAYTIPAGIVRFRVVQTAVDRLDAEIIPATGFDASAAAAACQQRWEDALGPGVTVAVRVVEQIPYASSGKLRYFVPLAAGSAPPQSSRH